MVVMKTQDFNQIKLLTFKIKNMKKYLYGALALPLLFACSSEDFEKEVVSNDQFAGIEKVDAEFSMEGTTRFDGAGALDPAWTPQEGDLWGFAWMGDGTVIANNPADGKAYQNHNLIQTSGIFTPQTSIYVGKYYIYRPYDKTTVSPQAINFTSLKEQALTEGYASTTQAWKDLAKTAINIGDKWTNVTTAGHTIGTDPTIWDKAGIKEHYKLYAAMFSNQTGLDLTYVKNNPTFAAAKRIQGATDIDFTIAAGEAVGSADIYEATVDLAGQAKSFTYAPTVEPNDGVYPQTVGGKTVYHNGEFWADKKNLAAVAANDPGDGFVFTPGAVKLIPADATNGLSTGDNGSKAWFWFNSLPVTDGNGALGTAVQAVFTSSYGVVTVNSTVGACAWAFEKYNPADANPQWIQLAGADAAATPTTPATWNLAGAHNTFINQYGNHKGKYALDVDFSTGVMNNMHIKNDTHLQKLLKFYIASGKNNENVSLNLDGASASDKTFKISKTSIALIQTINAAGGKTVKVHACGTHNNPVKIIVTQDGSDGKEEVPELNNVFDAATDVYLASGTNWTWKERTGANQLPVDANVASITNEGTLTVNAHNIQLTTAAPLKNAKGATMNITKVTTVKNALTNLGTINVGAADNTAAELRAYDVEIKNDATSLTAYGVINNYGVVGVTYATTGTFNNYGYIDMKNSAAITLLTSNQTVAGNFNNAFNANTNKLGTVKLPNGQPNALVSVSNGDETGFIAYVWDGGTTYSTPNGGTVKYNSLVVSTDIKFTTAEAEIKYIQFEGVRTTVTNSTNLNLPNLHGIIVDNDNHNASIIIEKGNTISCTNGAHLGSASAIYQGGAFTPNNTNITGKIVTDYLGTWNTDQVVKY